MAETCIDLDIIIMRKFGLFESSEKKSKDGACKYNTINSTLPLYNLIVQCKQLPLIINCGSNKSQQDVNNAEWVDIIKPEMC